MSTPEGAIKRKVSALLDKYGCYRFMPVQAGFGKPGLDYHCCVNGYAFFIETKAGNKRPTPRQEHTIQEIERAGGVCFVVNEFTGMQELEEWIKEIQDVRGRESVG